MQHAPRGKRRSAKLDLGCVVSLSITVHRSTAQGQNPESKCANRARTLAEELGFDSCAEFSKRVQSGRAIERAAVGQKAEVAECARSRGEAGGAGSAVGTLQRKASSAAFCFCETALLQQLLNIAQRQRIAKIPPVRTKYEA
jgi:hypothetical protein